MTVPTAKGVYPHLTVNGNRVAIAGTYTVPISARVPVESVVDCSTLDEWATVEAQHGKQFSSIVLKDESYASVYLVAKLQGRVHIASDIEGVDSFAVRTVCGYVTVKRLL